MSVDISIKRVYEESASNDGYRVLVDRLWPRGVSKADARIDRWEKELAPTTALRKWFHQDKENRYTEFSKKYQAELQKQALSQREDLRSKEQLTLVTAVKNIDHSHIPTLKKFLEESM